MTYELALTLKKNGFSQGGDGEYYYTSKTRPTPLDFERGAKEDAIFRNSVYIPTLSEFIEMCGEKFDNLEQRGGSFFAFGSSKDKVGMKMYPYLGAGKIPEEAVANLWLELNK